jgi:type I restriction enzyme S subunit
MLRPNPRKCDSRFLLYAIQSPATQHEIRVNEGTGSTVSNLRIPLLEALPIRFPNLAEQKAIAEVLGAVDARIDLNRRMNATLEAAARVRFDKWIFDNEAEVEDRSVQALINDGVLLVGDGYRAKNSEFREGGLPFVRAGNLRSDGLDLEGAEVLSATSVAAAGHKVGKTGDIAFTSKGTVGRITRVSSKTRPFVYSPQVCFWRSVDPDVLNPFVLYRWMGTTAFTQQLTAVSTQTDMAPYVSLQDQRRMVITLPPAAAQRALAAQLAPIDDLIACNAQQSRTLASIRDTLLPKLLSGELSVTGIEARL